MATITIIDGITGEQITRNMTDNEQTELEARNAARLKEQKAIEKAEKIAADKRQIILDRLGLTADEFTALLG
jgi:signal transduction histidine kinase